MKLWGQVVTGFLLVAAAVFIAVGYGVPTARWEALAAAGVMIAAAFGVPALVRRFSSFTGDEEVLANGLPYSATITSIEPTRLRYNRHYPVVEFSLEVQAGGAPYPVQIKQAVDPQLLEQLAPGSVVDVRVDRTRRDKVVIDWQALARKSGNPPGASGSRFPAGRTNAKIVGTMLLVLTLFFAGFAYEAWRYETRGVTVQGTAIGPSGKRDWTYSFIVDGRVVHGKSEVLWETASTLKPGGPVNVQYLSGAPETNRIPGQRAGYTEWRVLTVAALVAGVALLWRARRRRRTGMKP